MKTKQLFHFMAMTLLLNISATFAAGQGSSGGGIGFKCGEKIYLADTYQIIKSLDDDARLAISNYRAIDVLHASLKNRDNLKRAYNRLKFVKSFNVPIAGDDMIVEVPSGCSKVAIGYQNIADGTVSFNPDYYNSLTGLEQGYFHVHEGHIQLEGGIADTTPIRNEVLDYAKDFIVEVIVKNRGESCNINNTAHRVIVATERYFLNRRRHNIPFLKFHELMLMNISQMLKVSDFSGVFLEKRLSVYSSTFGAREKFDGANAELSRSLDNVDLNKMTYCDFAKIVDHFYFFQGKTGMDLM